ncbi:mannose-6-phosphate isomerase, class I [Aliivibrio sp. 1S165]|jgi:mannose-6-phosphate isomerase|uniref:mannose-6-phosphate isomerase, class I n=1 Tax=unclassified Aliivibrio TaxID=2645654 RepID=UPI00080EDAA1|nr:MULTISPECIES: mannose-6-phosphate isomerase, class I [unclassified Aliivibrio]OCH16700.1 mannose-6-phosphate isomerase, class I [Aliivibrio sp. 1S165]OCH32848.1 mannose-6-phosphate isomerase, class I [Aliivibrio sp. 1S175]
MQTNIFKLDNVIQNYAWGSQTSIQQLFGIENQEGLPQAEIWMGAHPNGCSKVEATGELLSELIKKYPIETLGRYTHQRFGDLPYLFKVLAADKPLSVQVHPKLSDAKLGFEKENQQGIELGAFNRNYKDANHKPELVYALTFYRAMNGFRPIAEMVSIFEQANVSVLSEAVTQLKASPTSSSLQAFFTTVMSLTGKDKTDALAQLIEGSDTKAKTKVAREAFGMVAEFSEEFSDDIGLFSPLMLNVIELEPGEAMFLHAATPHAYVQGTGLEIMANSDNVLRAGLTPKHMDIEELISHTEFHSIPFDDIRLHPIKKERKHSYPIPVDDFGFEIIEVVEESAEQYVRGAEILFCIEGEVIIESDDSVTTLHAGQSVFVCNNADVYSCKGKGTLARAYN